ncbi:hypothetical protein V8C86DRAFT_2647113 [Haematococcus lacustris]
MAPMVAIAGLLSPSLGLHLNPTELLTFCCAPADVNVAPVAEAMLRFAALYLEEGLVPLAAALPDYPSFIHTPHTAAELKALEEQHAVLDLYVWLAYRLPLQFRDQDAAVAERALLAERISQGLAALSRFHVPRVPRPRAKQYGQ